MTKVYEHMSKVGFLNIRYRSRILCLSFVLAFFNICISKADQIVWKPIDNPLKTHWTNSITPENALLEYPRPTMVRPNWKSLNGLWNYAIESVDYAWPRKWDGQVLVPFPIESSLSGVMKILPPDQRLWYECLFDIPSSWKRKRILLHFGAVDWETTVFVNKKKVGIHQGGYEEFSFDISEYLIPNGPQQLILCVFDPTDTGIQPHGKQKLDQNLIYYTPSSGIWQTVWLEEVPDTYIDKLFITPDVDSKTINVRVNISGTDNSRLCVQAFAKDGSKIVGKATGMPGQEIKINIDKPRLWCPHNPFLYDLRINLLLNDRIIDTVDSYAGMRKISITKDEKGIPRFMLNDTIIFQIGVLDQGFWPDGLYTAPSDEALRYDLQVARKLGFTTIRKHHKIEPERWYFWADTLGILVWQDMPGVINNNPETLGQYNLELKHMIQNRYNHPSIIMWIWEPKGDQNQIKRALNTLQELDATRLINILNTDEGTIVSQKAYSPLACPEPRDGKIAVIEEFGGLYMDVSGHMWHTISSVQNPVSSQDSQYLSGQYAKLLNTIWHLIESPGLAGAIYTQIADVENQHNGLMTYDRKIIKPIIDVVLYANRGVFPTIQDTVVQDNL